MRIQPIITLLIAPSGAGKSYFAQERYRASEILNLDTYRKMLTDDESNQESTGEAVEIQQQILKGRLARGKHCVIDSTNLKADDRSRLIETARIYKAKLVAVVFNVTFEDCIRNNKLRVNRQVPEYVIERQWDEFKETVRTLNSQDFSRIEVHTPDFQKSMTSS